MAGPFYKRSLATPPASYNYLANSPLVSQITYQQNSATRMTTTKQYDYLNRLTQISSAPGAAYTLPLTYNYNYNPANQRTKDTLADGSYWVYGYDSLGQVTNGCKYFATGTPVPGQQFDYTFDTIGNRLQTMSGGNANGANLRLANYTNNSLNQIIGRDIPTNVDIMGASISTNTVIGNGQTAYRNQEYYRQQLLENNASSALGNVYVPKEPENFSYDLDGNLLSDGRWAYTWDEENRLVGMTNNTGVGPLYGLGFAYDPKGRRIQKLVATNSGTAYIGLYTTTFLYDGWNLVAELAPNNSPIHTYMWGSDLSGSMQGAGGVAGLLKVGYYGTTTTNCFPAFDGNGDLSALINSADGTLAANYEYGPFGEAIRSTGLMARANSFRYSTKYQDDERDYLYYGYRYYKTSTGTWLNRDPFGDEAFLQSRSVGKTPRERQSLKSQGCLPAYVFDDNNSIGKYDVNGLSVGAVAGECIIVVSAPVDVPAGAIMLSFVVVGGVTVAVTYEVCRLCPRLCSLSTEFVQPPNDRPINDPDGGFSPGHHICVYNCPSLGKVRQYFPIGSKCKNHIRSLLAHRHHLVIFAHLTLDKSYYYTKR